jgi:hypothetical protein
LINEVVRVTGYEYVTADGSEWNERQKSEHPIDWGYITLETLEAMVELPPSDGSRRWVGSDYEALHAVCSLEGNLRYFGLPNGSSDDVVDGLHGFLDRWYGALPLDEPERTAVYHLHLRSSDNLIMDANAPALAELLRTTELEFMSSGVRRAVRGRDLLQRWWEWRRGVGEFEGQGSYKEATKALGLMTARLLTRSDIDAYYDLMGREVPPELTP